MSIAALLRAAEYLERREREAEHGYASTMIPTSDDLSRRRPKSKRAQARSAHNELEKNRRAHLRTCLEKLKEIVPLGPQYNRHTTLGLLTKAKSFIKNLEDKERKHQGQIDQLLREQRFLRRKLDLLGGPYHYERKRRSVSECSSTTPSTCSTSETDEVDIMGYNSNSSQSDTDDHSSIQSTTSDGGVSVFTKRLHLGDNGIM